MVAVVDSVPSTTTWTSAGLPAATARPWPAGTVMARSALPASNRASASPALAACPASVNESEAWIRAASIRLAGDPSWSTITTRARVTSMVAA
jgi:hypothetical protein